MKRILGIICLATFALALGCKGGAGGKCEKLIDKGMEMAAQMGAEMAKKMGGDDAAKMAQEQMEKAKKEMEAKKPEAIKKCEEELKKNPDAEKTVDCLIGADSLEAMSKCEGADQLGGLMK